MKVGPSNRYKLNQQVPLHQWITWCSSRAMGLLKGFSSAEVTGENGQVDKLMFEGLAWKVRWYYYR
jgi:hypothetical protein